VKLKLAKRIKEADNIYSLYWEPQNKITYLPGQYYYFTLPNLKYSDPRGATRHFTLSSSPSEEGLIRFTTKIREESGYKKTLFELKIGTEIEGEGSNGTFILDENEKGNHVLIAGGIGITPFRSFIKYNIDKKLTDIKIHLIYSNSTPEEITFKNELEEWSKSNDNIKIAMTITKPEENKQNLPAGRQGWNGLTGRIDEKMIKKLTTNYKLQTTKFWLCGPPPMVEAMERTLLNLKISPGHIRSEKFTGY